MTTLKRNETPFYYCLYLGKTEIVDSENNATGEFSIAYADAKLMKANISQATGNTSAEQYGNAVDYDKSIVTADMNCPIDENTVLFIDKEPEYDDDGIPLFDYIVKKVAKSLNSISIAVKKVSQS